ncbi:hypothetical protein JXD38_00895 [candidate division WOR-3 bacterium]|nr:hypothetical protein [candidate division WOR-3 bacterium]
MTVLSLVLMLVAAPADSPPGWTPDTLLSLNDGQESRDPALAIDNLGRLHAVWKDNRRLGGYDEIHYRCKDSTGWGEIFSVGSLDTVHNTPDIAVGADNGAHVVFMRRWGGPYTYFDVGYRRRDGATGDWDPEERLTYQDSLGYSGRPLAVVASDTVFAFWLRERETPPGIVYCYKTGRGWTAPQDLTGPAAVPTGYYDVHATGDGWVHVVWQDARTDTQQLWHRFHNGDSWSTAARITFHGYEAIQPDMDSDSAGNIHLTYSGGGPELRIHYRIWNRDTMTWGAVTHFYSWAGAPRPMVGVNKQTGERHLTHVGNQDIWALTYRRYDPGSGQWADSTMLTWYDVATGPAKPMLDEDGYVHLLFWDQRFGSQEEVFYKTNHVQVGVLGGAAAPPSGQTSVRPTVASSAVRLLEKNSAWLLDAAGRRVLLLKPGTNSVKPLAEGIYFVRPAQGVPAAKLTIRR